MAYSPFRNIGLKFLSICIATLLWLVVAGDRVVERALRVPLEFQNLPAGLEIVGDPVETVDVRVRGSSGTLSRLTSADTSAVIDLRNARPGRRLYHLTGSQINVPYGVDVVQVAPATMLIRFENSAVRVVQVRPSIEGMPAPGFEVVNVTADPATVEVIGPESALHGLTEAMTEPISVADARRPVTEVVTVGVADPTVRLREATVATVTIQIAPGSSSRTLTDVPVTVINVPGGMKARLLTPRVSIEVKGTRQAIQSITPEAVQALADAGGMKPGEQSVDVKAVARPGLTVTAVTPRTVRIRIGKS